MFTSRLFITNKHLKVANSLTKKYVGFTWTTPFFGVGSFDPGRGMPLALGAGIPLRAGDIVRPGEACRAPLPGVRARRLVF